MLLSQSDRPHRLPPPALVLGLGILLTIAATYFTAKIIEGKDRERFENAVQVARDDIRTRMEIYTNALLHVTALFAASQEVEGPEFRRYVRSLAIPTQYPGILGIGFAERFGPEEVRTIELRERRTRPEFHIFPDDPRPEMTAIIWLEPEGGRNQRAIGFDMFSEPVRRAAMERARDRGEPAASGTVTLVQETEVDPQNGFLLYVPVYEGGATPASVAERRQKLKGYVYSPFRGEDLFAGVFGSQEHPRLNVSIRDAEFPDRPFHELVAGQPGYRPRFREQQKIEMAGREWLLTFTTRRDFELGSQAGIVPLVALAGSIISLLLFAIVMGQSRAREEAERSAAELRESEEALRLANQAKDEFLAMLGHELRNPLAAQKNSLEVLKLRLGADPAARRALEVSERQLRHQTRLVEDLLDVSRVTSGKINLRMERLDLRNVVQHAIESLLPRLEERQHGLSLSLPDEPLWVEGDTVRLEQIVSNLLTNAVKYTPRGGEIAVALSAEAGQSVLRVRDNGVGIPPEMLDRIFELFTQAPTDTARSDGGLGLGLTLVRSLVRLHGGSVSAASEGPGRGSEFTVRLPLAAEAAPAEALGTETASPEGRCVVVVEDNEDARETLLELLEIWGHTVKTAEDGTRGAALILETKPEVALVDIGLPGMDGYGVARTVRAAGLATRLVAVTGYGQPEDRRRTAEAGFDLHLVKPVDLEELSRVLGNGKV